jgi:GLPGLI family protein
MKKIILIICAVICHFAYAQSGKATYSVKFIVPETVTWNPSIKEDLLKMVESANRQEFLLQFNKTQSSFTLVNNMGVDESEENKKLQGLGAAMTGGANIYLDHDKKIEIDLDFLNTIVKKEYVENKWEITKESKQIGNYLCYKATQKVTFINRSGKEGSKEIYAWFAPSLPYNYGPKRYYGLPGLILELQDKAITFLLTKIELQKSDIVINFPKGKTVSDEEYVKKIKNKAGL